MVMEYQIEDKIERILRITGGSTESQVKNDASSFKWINTSNKMKDFYQYFEYINDDNCLSPMELKEFEMLKTNGLTLSGDELDKELNEFFESPSDTLIPFDDIYLESVKDEIEEARKRIDILRKMHEQLPNDIRKTEDELHNMLLDLKVAKETLSDRVNDVFAVNKKYSEQLETLKKQSSEVQEHLLQLKDYLTSDHNTTYYSSESTYTSMIQSFDSSMKSLQQEQYLLQMNCSKYESLNVSFQKTLDSLIWRQLDKPLQNKNRGRGGDFESSFSFMISFKGVTIDVKTELKRLFQCLQNEKQEKLIAEATVMGVNKTIARIKQLQNDLAVGKWQPTLSSLRLDSLNFVDEIEELDKDVSNTRLDLIECCHEWADWLIQRVFQDLLSAKIAKKQFLIAKADEILDMLLTREAYSVLIWILLVQEQQRIASSANFISEVWSLMADEVNYLREGKILIENNHHDYFEFMSRPGLEGNELVRRLASLMKAEVSYLSNAVENLQDSMRGDETILLKQYAEQIQSLNQMKHSLRSVKRSMFMGPVNTASVIDHRFYSQFQKMEEKIVELAFNLRCIKMDFIKTQNNIKKDPFKRELQMLWVKCLVHPEQLADLAVKEEADLEKE